MKKLALNAIVLFFTFAQASFAQKLMSIGDARLKEENGKWYKIEEGRTHLVDDKVVTVKLFKNSSLDAITKKYNLTVVRKSITDFIDLRIPEGVQIVDIAGLLNQDEEVAILDINTIGEYAQVPNDPQYNNQWGLPKIGMPSVWDMVRGGTCIDIAVIDSGIDIAHPDLGNGTDGYNSLWANVGEDAWTNPNDPATGNGVDDDGNGLVDDWRGWDFDAGNNDIRSPGSSHGTMVSGIVAAKTNNGTGIAGIGGGYGGAGFRIIFAGSGDAVPNSAALDDAILYAVARGAEVIQMSLSVGQTAAIDNAIQFAVNSGVPVINASGNGGSSTTLGYPASNINVIAVGGTDINDSRYSLSNHGPDLFISAPATGVRSTLNGGTYGSDDGTSFAAPHVSAVIGLIRQINSGLSIAQIRNILSSTADKVGGYSYNWNTAMPGHSRELGFGRLNARKAIEMALGGPIAGADILCSNTMYTLTGIPPSSVTWSSSNANILTINPSTGAAIINGNGRVSITASISTGCGIATLTKTVWVGEPGYFDISGLETICTNNLYQYNITANNPFDQAAYSWSSSSPNLSLSGNGFSVNASSWIAGTYLLNVTAQNVCGTSSNSLGIDVVQCFASYTVYPNPAKDQVSIRFEDFTDATALPDEILLLSEHSTKAVRTIAVQEAFERKAMEQGNTLKVDVRDLPRGIYYLHIKNSRRQDEKVDIIRILLE